MLLVKWETSHSPIFHLAKKHDLENRWKPNMYSEYTLMKRYFCSSCFYLQANAKEAAWVGNIVRLTRATGTWFYVLFAETILIYHPAIWKSWKCAEDLFGQKSLGFIAELEPKVHFWAANKGTASICHVKKRRAPIGNHLFSTYWQHLSSILRRKPIRNFSKMMSTKYKWP